MENKILTAEEFLESKVFNKTTDEISIIMKEFAKLHVDAALKEASEKAFVEYEDLTSGEIFDYTDVIIDDNVGANVNTVSILNAYPLDLIK